MSVNKIRKIRDKALNKVRSLFIAFAPTLFSAILALGTIRISSSILTPSQLGQFILFLGAAALVDALFGAAASQTVYKLSSVPESPETVRCTVLIFYRTKYVVVGGTLLVLYVLGVALFADDMSIHWILIIFGGIVYAVFDILRSIGNAFLHISGQRGPYAVHTLIDSLLQFSCIAICLLAMRDPGAIFFALPVSKALSVVALKFRQFNPPDPRLDDIVTRRTFTFEQVASVLKIGYPTSLMGILGWITSFADRYVVALVVGMQAAGIYGVAVGILGRPINVLSNALTVVYRPELYKIQRVANPIGGAVLPKPLRNWLYSAVSLLVVISISVVFASDPIVHLVVGEGYRAVVADVLPLLSLGLCISLVTHAFDNEALASGNGERLLVSQAMWLPFSIFSIALGGVMYGLSGVVYARIFSELGRLTFTVAICFIYKK